VNLVAELAAGLSDAITSIRSELSQAMASGEGEEIRFRLGPVELEFEIEARKDAGATAGVKFWVVSAAAKGDVSSGSAHRIKLTLQPVTTQGADVEVAADRREPPPRWSSQGS
jgi:hypothetical protein